MQRKAGPGNTNVCSSAHRQDLAIRLNRSEHVEDVNLRTPTLQSLGRSPQKPAKDKTGREMCREQKTKNSSRSRE